jgi:hypothetical protein
MGALWCWVLAGVHLPEWAIGERVLVHRECEHAARVTLLLAVGGVPLAGIVASLRI